MKRDSLLNWSGCKVASPTSQAVLCFRINEVTSVSFAGPDHRHLSVVGLRLALGSRVIVTVRSGSFGPELGFLRCKRLGIANVEAWFGCTRRWLCGGAAGEVSVVACLAPWIRVTGYW